MSEGQFVDFATLEDWEMRDREKTKRLDALEAKLAKAVGGLQKIWLEYDPSEETGNSGAMFNIACATLAELKGEADDK